MKFSRIFTHHPFFIRLLNWEYWSFNTIYALIYPIYVWLIIRNGFKFFFSASNPSIENGGFLMEKKHEIYPLIPPSFYPSFFCVQAGTNACEVLAKAEQNNFQYPLIAKPNIGMQGKAVKKINNREELKHYAGLSTVDYLVQQLSPYGNEVGIFYHRVPGEQKGKITGIVAKEPMVVKGDGTSSLYQLICEVPRYILQMDALQQMYGEKLQQVLPAGEEKILAPYGNHARGSKFLDWTFKADEQLVQSMDVVCRQVNGFYFGRLDIMYNSWEELCEGKNFHIIELNGAGSDPTHMYDPRHSVFFAWKEIIRHWLICERISRLNHKKGHVYLNWKQAKKMFSENRLLVKRLNAMAKKL
jgi:hypothetical protein